MSKKFFALLLMAVMMLFAVNAVAEDAVELPKNNEAPSGVKLCPYASLSHKNQHEKEATYWVIPKCGDNTEVGYKMYKCTECPNAYHKVDWVTEYTAHSAPVAVPAVPGTCQDKAISAGLACEYCGEILAGCVETELNPDNHTSLVPQDEVKPVCGQMYYAAYELCEDCGAMVDFEPKYLDTTVCIFGNLIDAAVEATCQNGKTAKYGCINPHCTNTIGGDTIEVDEEAKNAYHQANKESFEPIAEQKADHDTDGYSAGYLCPHCDAKIDVVLTQTKYQYQWNYHKNKDNLIHHAAVEATCQPGNSEYWECDVCHKIFTEKDTGVAAPEVPVIAANAAKYHKNKKNLNPKDAVLPKDCMTDGKQAGYECPHCDYFDGLAVIPASLYADAYHANTANLTKVDAEAPTCTTDGNLEYYKCEKCNNYTSLTEEEYTVAATQHNLKTMDAQAATCKDGGWNAYQYCENCDYSEYEDAVIPALGDAYHTVANLNPVDAQDPDCESVGWNKYYTCPACGEEIGKLVLDALGHDFSIAVPDQDATCTTDGYKDYKKCSRPGCIEFRYTPVSAPGHSWETVEAQAPTCRDIGWDEYKYCPVCTETDGYNEYPIDENYHKDLANLIWVPAKAADCVAGGYTAHYQCKVCGTPTTEVVVSDPLGHDWDSKTGICEVCDAVCDHEFGDDNECDICGYLNGHEHDFYWVGNNYEDGMGCSDPVIDYFECECGETRQEAAGFYHDWRKGAVVIPGSCTVEQQTRYTCKNCGETELRPSGFVHNFVVKTVPGDCYNKTWVGGVCTKCGEKDYDNGMWTERVHAWNVIINKPATCTEEGRVYKVCPKCDAEENYTIEKIDHNMVETTEIVPATCKDNGGILVKCSMCGKTEVKVLKDANGKPLYPASGKDHDFGEHYADDNTEWKKVDATCTTAAYWLKTCKVCGATETEAIANSKPVDHSAKLVRTLTAATCTTDGVGKYACRWCGEDMGYRSISKDTAHTYKTTYIKEATCGAEGEEHLTCTKCGATKKNVLNKIPYHVYETEVIRGNCGEWMKVVDKCTVCGNKEFIKYTDTLTPHVKELNTKHADYVYAAPCSEKKGMDVFTCKYCKEVLETKETYGAHNYVVTTTWVDASCGQHGGYKQVCELCNKETVYVVYGADGKPVAPEKGSHEYDVIKTVESNCSEIGYNLKQCNKCGNTIKDSEGFALNPNAHVKVVVRTLLEAGCKNQGIVVKACKFGCPGEYYEVTDMAHTWVVKDTKPATCVAGYEVKYCSKCDATEEKELAPVRAHKYVETMKAATCLANATYGVYCESCGNARNAAGDVYEEVANSKLPHTEINVVVTKKASCNQAGAYTYDCSVCKKHYTDGVIKSLGEHAWVKGAYVKADCVTAGGYKYTCTKCKAEYVDEIGEPALGHQLITEADGSVKWFTQKGNCTDVDYKYTKCNRCQKVVDKNELGYTSQPDKHDLKLEKTMKKATCTEIGVGFYKCADCGKELYQVIPAGHAWDKGTTLEAGNCGKGAKVEYKCTVEGCGATKTETAKPTGAHVWVYDLTNDTKDVVYKQCSVCGNRVVTEDLRANKDDQTACALYGHTVVTVDAKAPTCTEKGLTAGTKCSVCNKVLKAQEEVAATGHSFEEGKCTVCGAADPDCVACEHEFGAPVYGFNADLTMVVAKYTCTKCGEVKVEDVRPVK